jgi:2,4-dienoyl-CoA reductase-like NADH-dependent reductase (Old Yellow Enzyme family)
MSDAPFLPVEIGNLELKNRFLMSAAVDGMAADPLACYVTEKWSV